MLCHMCTLARVRLCPETIYFVIVQVQIILYELNSSYFPIIPNFCKNLRENPGKFEIFRKMINYRYGTGCKPKNLPRYKMTKRISPLNLSHEI